MEVTQRDVLGLADLKTVEQGKVMQRSGAIKILSIEDARIVGHVIDNANTYKVILTPKDGGGYESKCACPAHGICKHAVAALQEAHERLNTIADEQPEPETSSWKTLSQHLKPKKKPSRGSSSWQVIFGLILRSSSWNLHPFKAYMRSSEDMGQTVALNRIEAEMRDMMARPEDVLVTTYLLFGVPTEIGALPTTFQSQYSRRLEYGNFPGRIFELLRGRTVYLFDEMSNSIERALTVEEEDGYFLFNLDEEGDTYTSGLELVWKDQKYPIQKVSNILTKDPVWVLVDDRLITVPEAPPLKFLQPLMEGSIFPEMTRRELTPFLENYLPALSAYCSISLPESMPVEEQADLTERRVYMKEEASHLTVGLRVAYGDMELIPTKARGALEYHRTESKVLAIRRNTPLEEEVVNHFQDLTDLAIDRSAKFIAELDGPEALDWLVNAPPKLTEAGFTMMGEKELRNLKVNRNRPVLSLTISSGIDWFELEVTIQVGDELIPFKVLQKAVKAGQKYITLADGSKARLPDQWIDRFQELLSFAQVKGNSLRYSTYHLTIIDELLSEADQVKADEEFYARRERLKAFESIKERQMPSEFHGELRPYQKAGFDWMCFLRDFHFGGCLADDMGLGKTIQTLALLAREYEDGAEFPSLIIAPTSVVFNWERECERFVPQVSVLNYIGLDRDKSLEDFANHQVVLTTYGIMRRDIELLKDQPLHYLILDESQYIKNPLAQTSKAARLLAANYRVCLTGTPVENHTSDLWSQFSFLNPGLLGNLTFFQNNFAKPIERQNDAQASERLRRLVKPFILRRTKTDVAKDLPEKTESVSYCAMTDDQQELYNRWREHYRDLLLKRMDETGVGDMRMKILEGLLRLRQICCHPKLVETDTKVSSGKMEVFTDLVLEALSEGHKILIFSQFVKMLQILKKELQKKKVVFEYLDGQTRNRQERIDNFQENDKVQVFLISLKAGGAGLNLTAADYVIHYDPWWNPAVEQQATDRSYRIGQTRPVFTYKLITRNSVEEKILELQGRKRELVEKLITTETSLMKNLTRDDVELLFS